jgi:Gpi18-like mannosyltransferase
LFADYLITRRILSQFKDHRRAANTFLFSPLILFVTYILGQNDLFPAIALLVVCEQILRGKWRRAGFFLGVGICMKFSLFLVLPFLLIYFIGVKSKDNFLKLVYSN